MAAYAWLRFREADQPRPPSVSTKYDWINRILAIGIGHRRADRPIYSLFEVL
jgi:hypothetical protein